MFNPHGEITTLENGWHLHLAQEGPASYRLAQLDDYATLPRSRFLWREQTTLSLRGRVSDPTLPGTWGFGLWNDPFTLSLGLSGMARRLPALPNCAWFFYASPHNHLSFARHKPASGFLAQTFSAPRLPGWLMAPGALAVPLLFSRPISRILRAFAGKIIHEDAHRLELDPTQWHTYQLQWGKSRVEFAVDGQSVFETATRPRGPLGLVIWIDNQFAAWHPDGRLGMGTLPNPPAWMEISHLSIEQK